MSQTISTMKEPARVTAVSWYVAVVLSLVYAINIADRYVVSTVLESIRLDFKLTDSQVGLMTGVTLALFYVGVGIPVSMYADRANRRNIVAAALAAWSLMTVCFGMAQSFFQLILARIGVGIGEAGGTAPSSSILADYFPPARRPIALTIFSLGAPVGGWLGSEVANVVADQYGWRTVFLVLGVPGVIFGLLIYLTVPEPRRGAMDGDAVNSSDVVAVPLMDTLRFIWSQKAAMHLMMGGAIAALWGWGLLWFTPTFLERTYGMTASQVGGAMGPIHLYAGTGATLVAAALLFMPQLQHPKRIMWTLAIVIALSTVPSFYAYWTGSHGATIVMLWAFIPAIYLYIGPTMGLLNNLVPPAMRAQTIAISLLMGNVTNLIIAVQAVAVISDSVAGPNGADAASLRFALLILAPTGFWSAWHYWMAIRHYAKDEARALAFAG
ncbi:MAG: spinster family MFS transporter [Sphingomonadaceae bacterium]